MSFEFKQIDVNGTESYDEIIALYNEKIDHYDKESESTLLKIKSIENNISSERKKTIVYSCIAGACIGAFVSMMGPEFMAAAASIYSKNPDIIPSWFAENYSEYANALSTHDFGNLSDVVHNVLVVPMMASAVGMVASIRKFIHSRRKLSNDRKELISLSEERCDSLGTATAIGDEEIEYLRYLKIGPIEQSHSELEEGRSR